MIVAERHSLDVFDCRLLGWTSGALLLSVRRRASSVTFYIQLEDRCGVHKPIYCSEGHGRIREDLAPFPERLIRGDQKRSTFIACADEFEQGKSVAYMPVSTWLANVALARSCGTYLRYRDKLAKPDVLNLDDTGLRKMSSVEAQGLCEILEERSINKSTIFTTQLPIDHWSEVIADPVIADAIRDRLQPAALTINITGESYRGVKARNCQREKRRVTIVTFGSAGNPQKRWYPTQEIRRSQLGNRASR